MENNRGGTSHVPTSPLTAPSLPKTKKPEVFTNASGYVFFGAPRRIRTSDLPLRRGPRYPAVPWERELTALYPATLALNAWPLLAVSTRVYCTPS